MKNIFLSSAAALFIAAMMSFGAVSANAQASRDSEARELFNKGVMFAGKGQYKDALSIYEQLAQNYGSASESVKVRVLVAKGLLNKGNIETDQAKDRAQIDTAINTLDRIDRNYGLDTAPEMREMLASALAAKAEAQVRRDNNTAALRTYQLLKERFGTDQSVFTRQLLAIVRWRVSELKGIEMAKVKK